MATRGKMQPKKSKWPSQKALVIFTVVLIALAVTIIWILSSLTIIPNSLAAISSIVVTVLGALFAFLQSMHLFFPPDKQELPAIVEHGNPHGYLSAPHALSLHIPPITVQLPQDQQLPLQSLSSEKAVHRGILGFPPPTDPRIIQQRENLVIDIYRKLTQSGITAITLTGIGGVGKSTLAALIYRYAEEQSLDPDGPFKAKPLWLTVDPAVTFTDLTGNLFEALGRPLPDLSKLAPQNQAVALFNALNTTEQARLIILDQFENLLDMETGHTLLDHPGVGEWLDIVNSQPCRCRVLLTSRPRPIGTREYPPTYLQEYPIGGLEIAEGIELLQKRGVKGTEDELRTAVMRCAGHAFSLTLLGSLVNDHNMNLTMLFKYPSLWIGDIARNLLDYIYTRQLGEVHRAMLLAFSVFREPVPFEAVQVLITKFPEVQLSNALKALRTQHLLEAVGEGRYQLHAIVVDYVQSHSEERDEQTQRELVKTAHAKATQYYQRQVTLNCPPRMQRRKFSDIHDLIELIWQLCQAEQQQAAFNLMKQEGIFADLRRWGGNAILLELCQLLLLEDPWQPEPLQTALIQSNLALVYGVMGQKRQALKYHEQALSIRRDWGDREGEGMTLNNLGQLYQDIGVLEEAMECHQQALRIFTDIEDPEGKGRSLNNLGATYRSLGQMDQALEYYNQALSIHKSIGDHQGEGMTLNGLGLVYERLGEKERAQWYFEQALNIRQEVGDRFGEGGTLNNLGIVYASLGERKRALDCYKQSLRIRKEIGDRGGEGRTLYNIGKLYFIQDRYDVALASFLLAKGIFEEVQIPDQVAAQRWIKTLLLKVGEAEYRALLTQVESQTNQIVEQALREGPTAT